MPRSAALCLVVSRQVGPEPWQFDNRSSPTWHGPIYRLKPLKSETHIPTAPVCGRRCGVQTGMQRVLQRVLCGIPQALAKDTFPLPRCPSHASLETCRRFNRLLEHRAMQDLNDVVYGKVKVNPNCGSLPRAEANWTETCESMEASVAKLQIPRRRPVPPRPRLPDPGTESVSSEVSRYDTSRSMSAQRAQPNATTEDSKRSSSRARESE